MKAPRLLMVDDEPDIGAFVRNVTESFGYDIAAGEAQERSNIVSVPRTQSGDDLRSRATNGSANACCCVLPLASDDAGGRGS